jgi:hypothetical protein
VAGGGPASCSAHGGRRARREGPAAGRRSDGGAEGPGPRGPATPSSRPCWAPWAPARTAVSRRSTCSSAPIHGWRRRRTAWPRPAARFSRAAILAAPRPPGPAHPRRPAGPQRTAHAGQSGSPLGGSAAGQVALHGPERLPARLPPLSPTAAGRPIGHGPGPCPGRPGRPRSTPVTWEDSGRERCSLTRSRDRRPNANSGLHCASRDATPQYEMSPRRPGARRARTMTWEFWDD